MFSIVNSESVMLYNRMNHFLFSDICLPRQVCCWPVLCKKGVSGCSVQSLQTHLQQHSCWESTAGGGGKTALLNTSWSVSLLSPDITLFHCLLV